MGERVPRVVKIHPTATSPTADSGFGFKLIGGIPILVESVVPGSRAETAGLLPGDRIVGVNGSAVNGLPHLHIVDLIKKTPPSSPLRLIAVNDGPEAVSQLRQVQNDTGSPDGCASTPSPSRLPRLTLAAKARLASPLTRSNKSTPVRADAGTESPLTRAPQGTPSRKATSEKTPKRGGTSPRRTGSARSAHRGGPRRGELASPSTKRQITSPKVKSSRGAAVGKLSSRTIRSAAPDDAAWKLVEASHDHPHVYTSDAWQPAPLTAAGSGCGLFLGAPAYAFVRKLKSTSVDAITAASFGRMQKMEHENVAALAGVCRTAKQSTCIAWASDLGPLSVHLESAGDSVDSMLAYTLCQQICNGLHYLHSQGVRHGRLAVENVLASSDFQRARLSEYGRCRDNTVSVANTVDDIHALGDVLAAILAATREKGGAETVHADLVDICRGATEGECPTAEFVCFKIAMLLENDSDDSSDDDSSDEGSDDALSESGCLTAELPPAEHTSDLQPENGHHDAPPPAIEVTEVEPTASDGGGDDGGPATATLAEIPDSEMPTHLEPENAQHPPAAIPESEMPTHLEPENGLHDEHPPPSNPIETEPKTSHGDDDDDDDLDFFALFSQAAEVHRDKDSTWSVERDEILDGPSQAELDAMPEPQRWRSHFRHLLDSDRGVRSFRKFLKKILAQENVDFWVDCSQLEAAEEKSPRLAEACEVIHKKYLAVGAPRAINITGVTRTAIDSIVGRRDFTRHTFAAAQKEIYFLMKRDSYPKFLESSVYHEVARSWSPLKDDRPRRTSSMPPELLTTGKPITKGKFFSFKKKSRAGHP